MQGSDTSTAKCETAVPIGWVLEKVRDPVSEECGMDVEYPPR